MFVEGTGLVTFDLFGDFGGIKTGDGVGLAQGFGFAIGSVASGTLGLQCFALGCVTKKRSSGRFSLGRCSFGSRLGCLGCC